jgi:hypothetical protein
MIYLYMQDKQVNAWGDHARDKSFVSLHVFIINKNSSLAGNVMSSQRWVWCNICGVCLPWRSQSYVGHGVMYLYIQYKQVNAWGDHARDNSFVSLHGFIINKNSEDRLHE